MRFPPGQELFSPMKILRTSSRERGPTLLALLTTTSSSSTAALTVRSRAQLTMSESIRVVNSMQFFMTDARRSEGEGELRFQHVEILPAALRAAIVLKLEGGMVVQVIPQTECRTVPPPHHRAVLSVT